MTDNSLEGLLVAIERTNPITVNLYNINSELIISFEKNGYEALDDFLYDDRVAKVRIKSSNLIDIYIDTEDDPKPDSEDGGSTANQDAVLATDVISDFDIGAINVGETFAKGTTFTQFVQRFLKREIEPTISFSVSIKGNQEVGTSINEVLIVNVTDLGDAQLIKNISWYENNNLKQTDIIDSETTGKWTYTMPTATNSTTTFRAIITYIDKYGTLKTTTKNETVSFYYKKFYGAVDPAEPAAIDILSLPSVLANSKSGIYVYKFNDARACYAYPKVLGELTDIKDPLNFDLMNSFTRSEISLMQNGTFIPYYCYTLIDKTTLETNYSITFT